MSSVMDIAVFMSDVIANQISMDFKDVKLYVARMLHHVLGI